MYEKRGKVVYWESAKHKINFFFVKYYLRTSELFRYKAHIPHTYVVWIHISTWHARVFSPFVVCCFLCFVCYVAICTFRTAFYSGALIICMGGWSLDNWNACFLYLYFYLANARGSILTMMEQMIQKLPKNLNISFRISCIKIIRLKLVE